VVCRPSQKEAEDYYHHAIIEMADWVAVDGMLAIKNITPATVGPEEYKKKREYFASRAIGGYPFVGSPDRVAEELATLNQAGVRGIAFSMINWLEELPLFRDEVLPRLARMGVRQAA
jgi:alkanesulfonate monooxygenase SsuD/methylene tetrahydromethanopterin reductase-like flavin-dependent oxidoreductase (luciferase family)